MKTRQELLALKGIVTKDVPDLPEWGTVRIRSMSLADSRNIGKISDDRPDDSLAAYLVIASVVNDDGTPTFTAADYDDILQLSNTIIFPLNKAINELNGYSRAAIEDRAKNSEASQTSSSSSV